MSVLIALVAFAWIAIALLGLAVGGLLSQVRALEARLGPRTADPAQVRPRLMSAETDASSGGFAVLFVDSACDVCDDAITRLLPLVDGGALIVATDKVSPKWYSAPTGVRFVVDPGAIERSRVPAVPWFAVVDEAGNTTDSFAVGSQRAIEQAVERVRARESP